MAESPTNSAPAAWLLRCAGAAPVEIWGLTPEERLRRALRAAGCVEIDSVDVGAPPALAGAGDVLLLRTDYIFDERLVRALPGAAGTLLVTPEGAAVAAHVAAARAAQTAGWLAHGSAASAFGLRVLTPSDLVSPYTAELRKLDPPYLLEARPGHARALEARTFAASYKGVTDLVTKWVWPRPAAW